ncbi:PREDICTED: lysine-specific demethylase JMJ706-like [Ipomoea nil]|uniref:lysine-specific demethylase JMJ706-like n=1 Tax=Ipomoea nil TaxID=35883 RepID=UPI000900D41F|nr:PREDICTED: lysine-specific demethylase JMJ706-like [Ipomoea nil]
MTPPPSLNLKSRKRLKSSAASEGQQETDWVKKMQMCPEYNPSHLEFQDPFAYLHKIAPEASKYGICKVVSPLDACVPAGTVLNKENKIFKFKTQLQPLRLAKWDSDDRIIFYTGGRKYTLDGFEKMAGRKTARKYGISGCLPASHLEKQFWEEMSRGGKKEMVEYGINIDGTAFSSSVNDPLGASNWNLNKLKQLPRSMFRLLENNIPGLTDPMLYIGMLFSMFAWHVEDHYLYSVNYHHCGAPKTWYGVPSDAALAFERVAEQYVYKPDILSRDGEDGAFEILAEKTTMFSPGILLQHHVPVFKAVQMPGEFVITFPRAYHAGFSHGFNCGEAVNIASWDWIPFGAAACHRYALLKRTPIIPYEQLLCKQAMLLAHYNSTVEDIVCVKSSFACLLRLYDCACWCLKRVIMKPSSLTILPKSPHQLVLCALCKRECYVAHLILSSQQRTTAPICLFHADNEIYKCKCESSDDNTHTLLYLYLREDMSQLLLTANKFEVDDDTIHQQVDQQINAHSSWLQTILCLTMDKYVPYSEVYHIENENKKKKKLRRRLMID